MLPNIMFPMVIRYVRYDFIPIETPIRPVDIILVAPQGNSFPHTALNSRKEGTQLIRRSLIKVHRIAIYGL